MQYSKGVNINACRCFVDFSSPLYPNMSKWLILCHICGFLKLQLCLERKPCSVGYFVILCQLKSGALLYKNYEN